MKKTTRMVALAIVTVAFLAAVPMASAFADTSQDEVCQGIGGTAGANGCAASKGTPDVNSALKDVIGTLSAIVGAVAVIMIIVGGIQFLTSSGDSSKVTTARHTITYAVIGLVVVAFAQFIVQFVLAKF